MAPGVHDSGAVVDLSQGKVVDPGRLVDADERLRVGRVADAGEPVDAQGAHGDGVVHANRPGAGAHVDRADGARLIVRRPDGQQRQGGVTVRAVAVEKRNPVQFAVADAAVQPDIGAVVEVRVDVADVDAVDAAVRVVVRGPVALKERDAVVPGGAGDSLDVAVRCWAVDVDPIGERSHVDVADTEGGDVGHADRVLADVGLDLQVLDGEPVTAARVEQVPHVVVGVVELRVPDPGAAPDRDL